MNLIQNIYFIYIFIIILNAHFLLSNLDLYDLVFLNPSDLKAAKNFSFCCKNLFIPSFFFCD